jgi:hypothetical protein
MPYTMKKTKGGKYQVAGPSGIHAKGSTKANAEAQIRLLQGAEHGMIPKDQKKSVHGSTPFTAGEISKGYRKLGSATDPRAGKQKG